MSLDETSRSVWETKKPPLAILVAARATEMVAAPLPEPTRAPFDALAEALLAWWPKRARTPESIYETEFRACLEAAAENASAQPAMHGAYVLMAAVLKVAPRSLPADGFYDMNGDEDFTKLLREAAKAGRLPLAQLDTRLKLLLDHSKEKWPELVARTARMRWDRGAPWSKLDKRVRDLASLADLGAQWSWSKVGAQNALRLELDGTKRIAVLSPEELGALRDVIPAIEEPA